MLVTITQGMVVFLLLCLLNTCHGFVLMGMRVGRRLRGGGGGYISYWSFVVTFMYLFLVKGNGLKIFSLE